MTAGSRPRSLALSATMSTVLAPDRNAVQALIRSVLLALSPRVLGSICAQSWLNKK
jgi:hypothetical protein